jgi:hypothetical protein
LGGFWGCVGSGCLRFSVLVLGAFFLVALFGAALALLLFAAGFFFHRVLYLRLCAHHEGFVTFVRLRFDAALAEELLENRDDFVFFVLLSFLPGLVVLCRCAAMAFANRQQHIIGGVGLHRIDQLKQALGQRLASACSHTQPFGRRDQQRVELHDHAFLCFGQIEQGRCHLGLIFLQDDQRLFLPRGEQRLRLLDALNQTIELALDRRAFGFGGDCLERSAARFRRRDVTEEVGRRVVVHASVYELKIERTGERMTDALR